MNGEGQPTKWVCALEYRSTTAGEGPPRVENVFALMMRSQTGKGELLVHPEWKQMASSADCTYLLQLLCDFKERLVTDPGALFSQVSNLSVGPVITHCAGSGSEEPALIGELRSKFVAF